MGAASSFILPPSLPSPATLRLLGGSSGGKLTPPFGVARWSSDEDADVVLLLERRDPLGLDGIAEQIPLAATLRAGALVLVLGELPAASGLGRWLKPRVQVSRGLRGSALLARGYTRLGAGIDPKSGQDLAWGFRP
jgi:hypothetical protein